MRVAGPHRAVWSDGARGLEQYAMPDGVCIVRVVDRPSGPPDCGTTVAIVSTTIPAVLSNYSGCFGLVAAAGNIW